MNLQFNEQRELKIAREENSDLIEDEKEKKLRNQDQDRNYHYHQ